MRVSWMIAANRGNATLPRLGAGDLSVSVGVIPTKGIGLCRRFRGWRDLYFHVNDHYCKTRSGIKPPTEFAGVFVLVAAGRLNRSASVWIYSVLGI